MKQITKYIPVKKIDIYLQGKSYSSISKTGSLTGMKKLYGWDKAQEIIYSGKYIYAIWG